MQFFLTTLGAIRLFLKLTTFSIIWCCLEMRQLCVIDKHNDTFHYGICLMPPLINQIIEFDSSSSLKRTLVNLLSSYYLPTNFNFFFCMCLVIIANPWSVATISTSNFRRTSIPFIEWKFRIVIYGFIWVVKWLWNWNTTNFAKDKGINL